MATPPDFSAGAVLTAAQMNAVGLWLVKTQTVGTAVSSVAVTNAFTSDFANYLVTMEGGTVSVDAAMTLTLTGSATAYYQFLVFGASTGSAVSGAGRNNQTALTWIGGGLAGQNCHVSVQVFGPNAARYTKFLNGSYQNGSNYGTTQGEHRVATAYTGITLAPDSGTLTGGTIRIYGYHN